MNIIRLIRRIREPKDEVKLSRLDTQDLINALLFPHTPNDLQRAKNRLRWQNTPRRRRCAELGRRKREQWKATGTRRRILGGTYTGEKASTTESW